MTIKLYNLLFERVTNKAISGFVDFFQDHILKEITEPELKYEMDGFPYFYSEIKASYNPSYEEYKKINPDDESIIIRNNEDLQKFLIQIRIYVYPKEKNPNVWGTMNADGELMIYNHEWTDKDIIPSPEEIKDYVKAAEGLTVHEIGHYINAFRSSHRTGEAIVQRTKLRGSTPGAFADPSTKEYKESTEEIQARITEFLRFLNKLIKTSVDNIKDLYEDKNEPEAYFILYALAKKDFQQFYDAALRTRSFDIMLDLYEKGTISPKTFKRLVGDRFWKIFEEYSAKDLDIYKAILDFHKRTKS